MGKFDNLPMAEVIYRREVTPKLMIIKIRPEVKIDFQPGQYCTFCLDKPCRPYSIASSPEEDFLEFFIELVDNGELTPKLWELKPGDKLKIFPKPKGKFIFDRAERFKNHFLVSTVTGVAPFVSMIRHLAVSRLWHGKRIFVFQGASYQDEFGYNDELSQTAYFYQYSPTVSRPREEKNNSWEGQIGRVNDVFLDCLGYMREEKSIQPADTLIYACGHPGMIEDVKSKAGRMGFEVREEKYYNL